MPYFMAIHTCVCFLLPFFLLLCRFCLLRIVICFPEINFCPEIWLLIFC